MRRVTRDWLLLVTMTALSVSACGDNGGPLATCDRLNFVAHQDDDLLFMQPELDDEIARGEAVTTVYVTAGNALEGVDYAATRIRGVEAAYGAVAHSVRGLDDWTCRWIEVAGFPLQDCRLSIAPVSLLFLAMPDGGIPGNYPNSVLMLWENDVQQVTTVSERPTSIDRAGLLDVLAAIMRATAPSRIDTLDLESTHGDDHSDHMIVGAAVVLAAAKDGISVPITAHRGYDMSNEPADMDDAHDQACTTFMETYEACVETCGACGTLPCTSPLTPAYVTWLARHYAVARRAATMHGQFAALANATSTVVPSMSCLLDGAAAPTLGACADAPNWTLTSSGQLRDASGNCVTASDDGTISMQACVGGPAQYFLFDDEGYLWSGLPPTPVSGMDYDHLRCLTVAEGLVEASLCGRESSQRWTLTRAPVITNWGALGLAIGNPTPKRAVVLANLVGDISADLCEVSREQGVLRCALGHGDGTFAAAVPVSIAAAAAPLAVAPNSLAIGDVDGDGLPDACGLRFDGVYCALAADGFATPRQWSSLFSGVEPTSAAAASIALVADGSGRATLCGSEGRSLLCIPSDGREFATSASRSSGFTSDTVAWFGTLDGTNQLQWCVSTDVGVWCGALGVNKDDGRSWSWSLANQVHQSLLDDGLIADYGTGALADVDGDGRADQCSFVDGDVRCATSHNDAFGPRYLMMSTASASQATLWLGDLDGDGRADVCVAVNDTLRCALSP